MDDGLGFLIGVFFAALLTSFLCLTMVTTGQGTEGQQFATVCDYENGVVKDNVCIVEGKVIQFNTEDKND